MGRMVLIGGGLFSDTIHFLRETISLSEKTNPEILIIPTAGKDSERAFSFWRDQFNELGSNAKPLYLIKNPPNTANISNAILNSDIVYVPGGDTLFMMRLWRKLGVDKILRKANRKGIVLSGRSAGAACWFRHSLGGAPPTRGLRFYCYQRITGIGLIDAGLCAHFQDRREPFKVFLQQFGGIGLGLDDNQAIIIKDGLFRLKSLDNDSHVTRVYVQDKMINNFKVPTLIEEIIEESETMRPLDELLKPFES